MINVLEMKANVKYGILGMPGGYCMKLDTTTSILDIVNFIGDNLLLEKDLTYAITTLYHGFHKHLWLVMRPSSSIMCVKVLEDIAFDVILGEECEN